jgi:hypothetical protein
MLDEMRTLMSEVGKLEEAQRGPYTTWLVVTMIRDISYYIVAGIVTWALGRRLIQGVLQAMRESRRERA